VTFHHADYCVAQEFAQKHLKDSVIDIIRSTIPDVCSHCKCLKCLQQ